MGFLSLLQLLFSLVPSIISTVNAVEKQFPGSGQGKQKLNTVLSVVTSAATAAPAILDNVNKIGTEVDAAKGGNVTPEHISAILSGVTGIVNTVVAVANETGVFGNDNEQAN